MARSRPIVIQPPFKGVVRDAPYEGQSPDSCYDALDVLPFDAANGRARLAVRPGFEDLGHDGCNLIAPLNVAPDEDYQRLLLTAKPNSPGDATGLLYQWDGTSNTNVGGTIKAGVTVHGAPYLQKLYIANHDLTPQVYTAGSPGTVGNWTATAGSVPSDCTLICEWANRIVMAGDPANPHVWYMSRIGDPRDWLYATDDTSSPVAATDIEGGQISEPIKALIPHNRDCIIFGYASGMTILRGNPVGGGVMERISYTTGPVSSCAWCRTPDDWTYILTRDGLAKMAPGCGSVPVPASEALPVDIKNIDGVNTKAYLAYDVTLQLIHIYLQGDIEQAWFYDPKREGFWPQTLPGTGILAIGRFDPLETSDESGVLVATSTGLMRLNNALPLGTGAAYATFGPFNMSPQGQKQLIHKAVTKFASNTTDNCTVTVYCAESAEDALALSENASESVDADTLADNYSTWYPRVGGHSAVMKIVQDDNTLHWAMEATTLYIEPTGVLR